MSKKSLAAGILIGIFFLFLTLHETDPQKVINLLSSVHILPILSALTIIILNIYLKSIRWKILLNSEVKTRRFFYALNTSYLVNNLLPARLGELARIYIVGRQENVGISKTCGSIFIEKAFDVFSLLLILLLSFFILPFTPLKVFPFFAGITIPKKWSNRLKMFFSSFKIFKDRKRLLYVFLISISIWVLEICWNYSLLKALNINLPIGAAIFIAIVINFGLFIPSPPGYIGVYHFLATFALLPWGIDKSQALSYAILEHALEYIFLTSLGLWSTTKLSFNPLRETKWKNLEFGLLKQITQKKG